MTWPTSGADERIALICPVCSQNRHAGNDEVLRSEELPDSVALVEFVVSIEEETS